ncbi:vitelline envelope sperm lysin receptor-like [Liolophura sinensis]|uniref:vitelline envelope sperm lysin receptor-like n=1 Tax=Liolophura sinensis TaxID=3198878 RepID=UPI0031597BDA
MILIVLISLLFISFSFADEKILHLSPGCPSTNHGTPHPLVRADVPAEVTAQCRNGQKLFTSTNGVKYVIGATLNQHYVGGDCQYYKKAGVNIYHIEVAIAWSEAGNEVYTKKETYTITCSYDNHGNSTSNRDRMVSPYIAPEEKQHLKGERHKTGNFSLTVIDVLGRQLIDDHLHIGRLVRLKAVETSGTITAFRALSCLVSNHLTSYAILRAGCGDGIIFGKKEGFLTIGSVVYSPYFDAFKLNGSSQVQFECNFTVCESTCNGDSCKLMTKKMKRSSTDEASDGPRELLVKGVSSKLVAEESREVPLNPENLNMPQASFLTRDNLCKQKFNTANRSIIRKISKKFFTNRCFPLTSVLQDPAFITALVGFGLLLFLSFTISLYLICKYEIAQIKASLNR